MNGVLALCKFTFVSTAPPPLALAQAQDRAHALSRKKRRERRFLKKKYSCAKGTFHRIAHLLDRSPCHPPRFLDKKKTPRFSRTLSANRLSIAVVSLRPKLAGAPYRTLPRCIFGSQAFRGASAHHGRDFFIRKIRRIFRAVFRKISSGAQKLHMSNLVLSLPSRRRRLD